jgi:hypothetical protein
MNRKQKLQEINKLVNQLPKVDLSVWTTDDLVFMAHIFRRVEGSYPTLKKTDTEFINAIRKMETKYNCQFNLNEVKSNV